MKQKSVGEIAEFLKTVYRGGFGIHLAKGNAAQYVNNAQVMQLHTKHHILLKVSDWQIPL